jgi:hypothetical protein
LPLPDAPAVTVIREALLTAVRAHDVVAVTDTLTAPPLGGGLTRRGYRRV